MTESMPPTLEQTRQLHRGLTQKVLDKAASDPQWKQQLIEDPEAAMRAANFPESQQLQRIQQGAQASRGGEVRGQSHDWDDDGPWQQQWCPWHCSWWTQYWWKSWWW